MFSLPPPAPRDVARKQRIHGTKGPVKMDPLKKLSSHREPGEQVPRAPIYPRMHDVGSGESLRRRDRGGGQRRLLKKTRRNWLIYSSTVVTQYD